MARSCGLHCSMRSLLDSRGQEQGHRVSDTAVSPNPASLWELSERGRTIKKRRGGGAHRKSQKAWALCTGIMYRSVMMS